MVLPVASLDCTEHQNISSENTSVEPPPQECATKRNSYLHQSQEKQSKRNSTAVVNHLLPTVATHSSRPRTHSLPFPVRPPVPVQALQHSSTTPVSTLYTVLQSPIFLRPLPGLYTTLSPQHLHNVPPARLSLSGSPLRPVLSAVLSPMAM